MEVYLPAKVQILNVAIASDPSSLSYVYSLLFHRGDSGKSAKLTALNNDDQCDWGASLRDQSTQSLF
jgi:hypothetical protein